MAQLQEKNAKLEENLKDLNRAHEKLVRQDGILKADLGRAQRMQQGLLPRNLPAIGTMDFFGFYQPCQQLGGDFFDLFPLGNDKIAVYIADVAGHGVRSALVTVILHQLIQTQRLLHPDNGCLADPAQALAFLNQGLVAEPFDEPVHVTMGYAVINVVTGEVSYGSAGHPSPLVIRQQGKADTLTAKGPGLGIETNPSFEVANSALDEGDFVLMYSDGLTECRDQNKSELTVDGLTTWAMSMQRPSAYDLGNEIEKRLFGFRNGIAPDDDITYVVLRRTQDNLGEKKPKRESVRIRAPSAEPEQPSARGAQLTAGWASNACVIRLSGRATWERAPLLLALLNEAKKTEGTIVFLDMSRCISVDSTMLGLIYQFYDKITVFCPTGKVTQQLSELGILQHVRITDHPLPSARMTIPPAGEANSDDQMRIVLSAHEALMGSSDENREKFAATVELMKHELGGKQGN
jgi:serine phosphatase RsbU (regulator of sigma subunit)/anti-anti-sigma regulatory factor